MSAICYKEGMTDERVRRVSFGEVVQYRRKLLGLTQGEVARRMDVSQNTVSRWELAAYAPPQAYVVERLADVLHVDPEDLRAGIIRTGGGEAESEHDQLVAMAARRARTPEELERMVATIEITLSLNPTGVLKMEDMARTVMQAYGVRGEGDGEDGEDDEEGEGEDEQAIKISR